MNGNNYYFLCYKFVLVLLLFMIIDGKVTLISKSRKEGRRESDYICYVNIKLNVISFQASLLFRAMYRLLLNNTNIFREYSKSPHIRT